jgi:hypothetical protein
MRAAPLALALVLLVGCSESKTEKEPAWHVRGSTVRGDVDGDGKAEDVAVEDQGPESCRFRIRARADKGEIVGPLELAECAVKPAETFGTALPSVSGLAEIDEEPGLEIVVETHRGASTEFATLFTARRDALEQIELPPPFNDDELPFEGSVTHFNVVDCGRPGVVVASGYGADLRSRVIYGRSFYRVDGTRLRFLRAGARGRLSAERVGDLQRYPEFREPQPFPSCMKVRPD